MVTVKFKMREAGFSANFEYGELHAAGNKEYGFRPYHLMVSSIAVCSGGVLRGILEKEKISCRGHHEKKRKSSSTSTQIQG
jgi:uncharacterized OsmC-like protein